MQTLCLILARGGSKGLPGKNVLPLLGREMIHYTLDHALAARRPMVIAVSSDDPRALQIAAQRGARTVVRPPELAGDTATVDSAARHAVTTLESEMQCTFANIVILYANIPFRPLSLIDDALEKLETTGCDSVQSVYRVGKTHPLWMRTLGGDSGDVLQPYQPNNIYRRQDLPPVYMLNGGLIAVRRPSLFLERAGEPHAFLGTDRRAIVTGEDEVIDVDTAIDLHMARALLESRGTIDGPAAIDIRGRSIGPGRPAYLIAELGVNHDGDIDRCMELVRLAHASGADAIKLQLFDAAMLLSDDAELATYQEAGETDPLSMLQRLQLPAKRMHAVRDLAHELGMGFLVTCFSPGLVDALRSVQPDAVKVASPDAVNWPLLDAVATLGRPLLISTGTCHMREVARTVMRYADHPMVLLHCVSAYPVPIGQTNLRRIEALGRLTGRPVGYSDHADSEHAGALAIMLGACVLERHLTYDTSAAGPDHAASLDGPAFARYVKLVREAEAMLLGDAYAIQPVEENVRKVSRQSICAAVDLPAGTILRAEHLCIKRPGTGIAAAELETILGRTLRKSVKANRLLRVEDLCP